ncbi:MAG: metal ABC transporter permease [Planctomycetes bacterium]|nr:metal ABC transporter permease [Planctomycetota bacterium]
MNAVFEALQYPFIQRAIISGVFIGCCCAFLGVFLVLRRLSLIGDGLAHVSLAAVGLGLLLNMQPLWIAIPLVMAASMWILWLADKADVYADAAIGLVSAVSVAVGITLASVGKGFNVDLFSFLFGNILAISLPEVILSVILSVVVIGTVILLYHELFVIAFEEEYAKVLGIPVERINHVLVLCTALTVSLGMRVVGTMLISSLIIFPAVTALQIARGFRLAMLLAAVFSIVSVLAGIFFSYLWNLPTGATIVLVNFAFFVIVFLYKRLR